MQVLGRLIQILGGVVFILASLIGFLSSIAIVVKTWGVWAFILGMVLFPIVFAVAPFYIGFALGDWSVVIVQYGGMLVGFILVAIGTALEGKP